MKPFSFGRELQDARGDITATHGTSLHPVRRIENARHREYMDNYLSSVRALKYLQERK
jgi:hypothetical protein